MHNFGNSQAKGGLDPYGIGNGPGPIKVRYIISHGSWAKMVDKMFYNIGSGATIETQAELSTAMSGEYMVTIIIDVDDNILESDEKNNKFSFKFYVTE